MEGIVGHRMPPLGGDNSLQVPGHSMMSQNGPFKLTGLRDSTPVLTSPTKRRSKSGNHGNKMPPIAGATKTPKILKLESIERTVEDVMVMCLQDVKYDSATCIRLSETLAGSIMEKIKPFSNGRYKMVAVASIGSIKEQAGMQFGSRCLWNKDSDSFMSVKYANDSLFAVAMIYCLLFE